MSNSYIFLYILLLGIFTTIYSIEHPSYVFGRPKGGFLEPPDAGGDGPWTDPMYITESNITQIVDHFNSSNTDTWKQRYQYNNKFYNKTNGLVFLLLGGESNIQLRWVTNEAVAYLQWAAEFGAAVFQVEHRFYGPKENSPYPDQTVASMQYMHVDQALADVKEFMLQMNKMYFANDNPKWITFGGSYPGSLSAWFRETYPEMTIGAVSTSSAVHVFVDYYGYIQNMENNYRNFDQNCAQQIQIGFNKMQQLAYNGPAGRAQLKTQFNLCEDFDETLVAKSVQNFFSNVIGAFQGINQYSGDNKDTPSRSGLGIPGACAIMTNTTVGSEMDRVNAVWTFYNYWRAPSQLKCNDNNYTAMIQMFSDTSYNNSVAGTRSWIWQTCTFLGYYQTTDYGSSIFGSTIPMDFFSDQCMIMFDKSYTLDRTFKLVDQARKKYGGGNAYHIICANDIKQAILKCNDNNYTSIIQIITVLGTKCVFPNGSVDPWKDLGMLTPNPTNDVDAFIINGTAHCADMYPPSPNDLQSLKDARVRIHAHLVTWITEAIGGAAVSSTMAPAAATTSMKPAITTSSGYSVGGSAFGVFLSGLFFLYILL